MGDTQNGWFIRDNPNLKWMMAGGTPISGNHPMEIVLFLLPALFLLVHFQWMGHSHDPKKRVHRNTKNRGPRLGPEEMQCTHIFLRSKYVTWFEKQCNFPGTTLQGWSSIHTEYHDKRRILLGLADFGEYQAIPEKCGPFPRLAYDGKPWRHPWKKIELQRLLWKQTSTKYFQLTEKFMGPMVYMAQAFYSWPLRSTLSWDPPSTHEIRQTSQIHGQVYLIFLWSSRCW